MANGQGNFTPPDAPESASSLAEEKTHTNTLTTYNLNCVKLYYRE